MGQQWWWSSWILNGAHAEDGDEEQTDGVVGGDGAGF